MFIIRPFLEIGNRCRRCRSQKKPFDNNIDFKNVPVCGNPSCPGGLLPRQKLKRCSRCKKIQYCSINCQRLHWKNGHSFKCNTKGKKNNPTDAHIPKDKTKTKGTGELPIYELTEEEAIKKFPHMKEEIYKTRKNKKNESDVNSTNEPSYDEVIQFVSHNVPLLTKYWKEQRKEFGPGVLVVTVSGKFSIKAKIENNDLSYLQKKNLKEFCPVLFGVDKDAKVVLAGKPILKKMRKLIKKGNVGVTSDQLEFYSSRAKKMISQLQQILKENQKDENMVVFAVVGKFSVSPVGQFPIV